MGPGLSIDGVLRHAKSAPKDDTMRRKFLAPDLKKYRRKFDAGLQTVQFDLSGQGTTLTIHFISFEGRN
jgi:hypothetical protein